MPGLPRRQRGRLGYRTVTWVEERVSLAGGVRQVCLADNCATSSPTHLLSCRFIATPPSRSVLRSEPRPLASGLSSASNREVIVLTRVIVDDLPAGFGLAQDQGKTARRIPAPCRCSLEGKP